MARLASIQRANSLRASASYASTTSKDSIDAFMSKFAKFAPPKFDAPSTPTTFMPAQAQATTTATPEKLTLNFYMPHAAPHDGEQVDMVLVPATTGDFGILPGHVPTVSQLRPGVVSVHVNDKDVKKYFVSSGFAFVHADSTADICAIEAVPVEQLDPEAVKKGLAEFTNKFANAKDDFEKAQAQIGIDVCNAMVAAVDAK